MRRCLDNLSSAVYLLSMKLENVKAVSRAHREFDSLRHGADAGSISDYLLSQGRNAGVKGIYSRWIVLRAVLKGDGIFLSVKDKDFVKI